MVFLGLSFKWFSQYQRITEPIILWKYTFSSNKLCYLCWDDIQNHLFQHQLWGTQKLFFFSCQLMLSLQYDTLCILLFILGFIRLFFFFFLNLNCLLQLNTMVFVCFLCTWSISNPPASKSRILAHTYYVVHLTPSETALFFDLSLGRWNTSKTHG